jgi:dTDP-4-dehydrorhamnose 3,5-epimerase
MQPSWVQMSEQFKDGDIEGVVVCELKRFTDERGWLAELFRHDAIPEQFHPVMGYISATKPGVTRGPHEHVHQADFFCFIGPSNFRLRMWDRRPGSASLNNVMTVVVGEDNPRSVLIPAGVVHAYQNVGSVPGIVINCPNRLYMGEGKKEEVDEIRHEDDVNTIFRMD